jgi:hypothetical protein
MAKLLGSDNPRYVTKEVFIKRMEAKWGKKHQIKLLKYSGSWSPFTMRCLECNKTRTFYAAAEYLCRAYPCPCRKSVELGPVTAWEEELIAYLHTRLLLTIGQIVKLTGIPYSYLIKYLRKTDLVMDPNVLNQKRTEKESTKNVSDISRGDYTRLVWLASRRMYIRYIDLIDPKRKRGIHKHLDHIVSIRDAYVKNSPPLPIREVAHPANLRMLKASRNISKGGRSDLTVRQLRKKIQEFEKQYGPVELPEYLDVEFRPTKPKRGYGLNVLSLDPGTANFAVNAMKLEGARSLHSIKPYLSVMLKNPLNDLKKGSDRMEAFKSEIREIVVETNPDVIVIERFQSRGLRGNTGEMVSMMTGMVCGMIDDFQLELGKKVVLHTPTASTWKNAFNRVYDLKTLYTHLEKARYIHRLDALLMGMSVFPVGRPYEFFKDKQKLSRLMKFINLGEVRSDD